jgi:topoisomerase-4 subunit B
MLGRTANGLFWMFRYLERAENTARLLEAALRMALTRGLRAFGELVGAKKAKDITADDVMTGAEVMLSVFIRDPQFQSQTKDRLTSPEAARLVENAVRDHFDHFLTDNMERGKALLGEVMERMDERLKRKQEREIKRKSATNTNQHSILHIMQEKQ